MGVDINDSRISLTQLASADEQLLATLTIRSAYEADEGLYKCRVSNGIGQDVTSSAAYLTVNCKCCYPIAFDWIYISEKVLGKTL